MFDLTRQYVVWLGLLDVVVAVVEVACEFNSVGKKMVKLVFVLFCFGKIKIFTEFSEVDSLRLSVWYVSLLCKCSLLWAKSSLRIH